MYVTNEGSDTVAMFEADTPTRQVTFFGTAPTGHSPRGLDTGRNTSVMNLFSEARLVVANSGSDTLSVYRVFPTGALELLHTVPTGSRPIAVSIPFKDSPTGPVNVLCTGSHEVIQYQFTDDSIAEVSRAATGSDPKSLVTGLSDNGTDTGTVVVLVSDGASNQIYGYTETPTGLNPTSPATLQTGPGPSDLAVFSKFFVDAKTLKDSPGLVVLNAGAPSISTYSANGSNLTPKNTSPIAANSHGLALNQFIYGDNAIPRDVYLANDTLHTIETYEINNQTGVLKKTSGAEPTAGSGTTNALVSIPNVYGILLATNSNGSLRSYLQNPTTHAEWTPTLSQTLDTHGDDPYGIGLTNVDVSPTNSDIIVPTVTGSPGGATVGTAYKADFVVAAAHYGPLPEVAVTSGSLPPGLSVTNIGVAVTKAIDRAFSISGTPTAPGTYTFSLTVTLNGQSVTKEYTIAVTGGGVPAGPFGRFFNLDPQTGHSPLVLKINGTTFPTTVFGTESVEEAVTPASSSPYEVDDATNTAIQSGSTFLSTSGTRFYFVQNALGFAAGQILPTFPASGQAGVVFVGGASIFGQQNVDVFLQGSTIAAAHDTITLGGTSYLQVPPGTYTVRVSNASTGATIVTSSAFTVAAGNAELVATTSDAQGNNPQIFAFLY